MMHERVSMELFRKMGLPAPRETHAKLYVNGDYVGLYTIVESIDKPFLRDRYGEDSGYLYNYQWQDAFFFEDRGPDPCQRAVRWRHVHGPDQEHQRSD
jgi:spore coat protein CotH